MGLKADYDTLRTVSRMLTDAADDMASAKKLPGDPGAGALNALFAVGAANTLEQTEKLIGKLGGAGSAVLRSRDIYQNVDEAARESLPKPAGGHR
ncbi:MAG: hypothetical protein ACRDQF_12145 [Thermocrispum sp.]